MREYFISKNYETPAPIASEKLKHLIEQIENSFAIRRNEYSLQL